MSAAGVVVEGEGTVRWGSEVVATDSRAWASLSIYWSEEAKFVLKDPYRTRSRTLEDQVVEFAAVIVVEGKYPIPRVPEIIAPNS